MKTLKMMTIYKRINMERYPILTTSKIYKRVGMNSYALLI